MIASLPCMQWLTAPTPRRPAGPATVSIPVTWYCHWAGGGASSGSPRRGRAGRRRPAGRPVPRPLARRRRGPGRARPPRRLQVARARRRPRRRPRTPRGARRGRPRPGRRGPSRRRRPRCTSRRRRSRCPRDVVLQQPVDDDHVAPDELLPAGDPLADRPGRGGRRPSGRGSGRGCRRCTRSSTPGGCRGAGGGRRSSSARSCPGAAPPSTVSAIA